MSKLPEERRRILILAAVVVVTGLVVTIANGNGNRAGIVGFAVAAAGLIAVIAFRSRGKDRPGSDRSGPGYPDPASPRRQNLTAGILLVVLLAAVILIPEDRSWTVPAFVVFAACILWGYVRRRR